MKGKRTSKILQTKARNELIEPHNESKNEKTKNAIKGKANE